MDNTASKQMASNETHENDSDPKVENISPKVQVTSTRKDIFVKLCAENASIIIEQKEMKTFNDFLKAGFL